MLSYVYGSLIIKNTYNSLYIYYEHFSLSCFYASANNSTRKALCIRVVRPVSVRPLTHTV